MTVQAQILDLLDRLKQEFNAAIVIVTHDLGVVAEHCDHIQVMYAGKIVEAATDATSTTERTTRTPGGSCRRSPGSTRATRRSAWSRSAVSHRP